MADITLNDIDEQIKKLQELRRVISDPAMAGLLNQLLASKNGVTPVSPRNTQGEHKAKGDFAAEILVSCKTIPPLETPFTIRAVIAAHEARGGTFTAKDKAIATYGALKRLVKSRDVIMVEQGIGSKPSLYRVAP